MKPWQTWSLIAVVVLTGLVLAYFAVTPYEGPAGVKVEIDRSEDHTYERYYEDTLREIDRILDEATTLQRTVEEMGVEQEAFDAELRETERRVDELEGRRP